MAFVELYPLGGWVVGMGFIALLGEAKERFFKMRVMRKYLGPKKGIHDENMFD